MSKTRKLPKPFSFEMGHICTTIGIRNFFDEGGYKPGHAAAILWKYIERHVQGDWGDIDQEDKEANNFAVDHNYRILSAYEIKLHRAIKIWIITEADRSTTTILLPGEY